MHSSIGASSTDEDIEKFIRDTLKAGQVIPGYGHAVLRRPDPRFKALMNFASYRPEIGQNPLFQLVKRNSRIAVNILKASGKVTKFRFIPVG